MTEDRTTAERTRFAAALDMHGADLTRWPEEVQSRGRALLAVDPAARALLAEARELAEMLNAWQAPTASLALRTRILDARPQPLAVDPANPVPAGSAPPHPAEQARPARRAVRSTAPDPARIGLWRPMAALAAATIFGVAIGLSTALPVPFISAADAAPVFGEEAAEIALGLAYSEATP